MEREEGKALLLLSQTIAGASSLSAWSAIIQYVKEGIGIQYTLPVPPSGSDLSDHGQISDLFAKMVRLWSDFCQKSQI
jgi:hypothetical protein